MTFFKNCSDSFSDVKQAFLPGNCETGILACGFEQTGMSVSRSEQTGMSISLRLSDD